MVFSSPIFLLIFLPIVFLVYKILPKKAKNYVLIAASLFFYAWGEPIYILLMIGSVIVNYLLALLIGGRGKSKLWLLLCVILNIGMLFVFKYANFFVGNVNSLFGISLMIPVIRLPIGISFFTFQAMSYVIDVYRGRNAPQKNFANVLLYISFFPQLIAGPIVKYHDIAQQIQTRAETHEKTVSGLQRFTVGLAKKLFIANTMGSVADKIFALEPMGINISVAWIGAIAYALQIYFDFSGYSDMAIGLAKIFGFDLKENFLYPYTANSIKTFWRKWHISLSTWFKEYLYIPLGGNRKGRFRTSINLVIVFFCTGLWHGAEWTFVVWGFIHGLLIMLERRGIIKPERFKPKWLGNVYTVLVAVVAFTIFRAATLKQGFSFIGKMFAGFGTSAQIQSLLHETLTASVIAFGAIAIIGATPLVKNLYHKMKNSGRINTNVLDIGAMVLTIAMLILSILSLASDTYNPFIYFRF